MTAPAMAAVGELWAGGPVVLPAEVAVDGRTYRLRARSTVELLDVLARGDWPQLVPNGLIERDRMRLARRLYHPYDPLDLAHCWALSTAIAGRLAGVDVDEGHDPCAAWWPATRLASHARTHWLSFEGWAATKGCGDLLAGPLHRLIAVAWQFAIEHRPSEGAGDKAKPISVEALRERMWLPPTEHRRQVMRFTASKEREAALAALRDVLPT
ncbi:hypothetical protein [Micromonospora sp. NPDC049645]|uniref:hypothetical protein n=1 Tax=Micromonospora sp. NPDC049645 TaxID=3155508 RepID=UPI0034155196